MNNLKYPQGLAEAIAARNPQDDADFVRKIMTPPPSTEDSLLPCPFCGGPAEHVHVYNGEEIVGCADRCAVRPCLSRETYEWAATDWNRRALPAPGAQAWQPIETAPKDGTRVLLAWGNLTVHGFWLDNSNTRTPWAGWRVGSMEIEPRGHVTHWMPLPLPPAKEAKP